MLFIFSSVINISEAVTCHILAANGLRAEGQQPHRRGNPTTAFMTTSGLYHCQRSSLRLDIAACSNYSNSFCSPTGNDGGQESTSAVSHASPLPALFARHMMHRLQHEAEAGTKDIPNSRTDWRELVDAAAPYALQRASLLLEFKRIVAVKQALRPGQSWDVAEVHCKLDPLATIAALQKLTGEECSRFTRAVGCHAMSLYSDFSVSFDVKTSHLASYLWICDSAYEAGFRHAINVDAVAKAVQRYDESGYAGLGRVQECLLAIRTSFGLLESSDSSPEARSSILAVIRVTAKWGPLLSLRKPLEKRAELVTEVKKTIERVRWCLATMINLSDDLLDTCCTLEEFCQVSAFVAEFCPAEELERLWSPQRSARVEKVVSILAEASLSSAVQVEAARALSSLTRRTLDYVDADVVLDQQLMCQMAFYAPCKMSSPCQEQDDGPPSKRPRCTRESGVVLSARGEALQDVLLDDQLLLAYADTCFRSLTLPTPNTGAQPGGLFPGSPLYSSCLGLKPSVPGATSVVVSASFSTVMHLQRCLSILISSCSSGCVTDKSEELQCLRELPFAQLCDLLLLADFLGLAYLVRCIESVLIEWWPEEGGNFCFEGTLEAIFDKLLVTCNQCSHTKYLAASLVGFISCRLESMAICHGPEKMCKQLQSLVHKAGSAYVGFLSAALCYASDDAEDSETGDDS